MSMFRPRVPLDAGHEQHDVLLIAQYVARDPLRPEQVSEAAALLGSCRECAGLASDLGAISRAVASEPVPSRRRDFTVTAEQAQRLRGSPLQRFMRRLALPESRSLRPLAAGVMSLGLVLVIAGSIIPQAESEIATTVPATDLGTEMAPVDDAAGPARQPTPLPLPGAGARSEGAGLSSNEPQPGAESIEEPSLAGAVDAFEQEAAEFRSNAIEEARPSAAAAVAATAPEPERAPEVADMPDAADVTGGADVLAGAKARESADASEGVEAPAAADALAARDDGAEFADAAPTARSEDTAKRSLTQKARLDDEVADADRREAAVGESQLRTAPPGASEQETASAVPSEQDDGSVAPSELDGTTGALIQPDASPLARSQPDAPAQVAASQDQVVAAPAADGLSIDELLVAAGIALVIAGSLFLLLIWFARRRNPDPLAP